jgi:CRISPR-associated protein (TIGR02710 family)
MKRTKNLLICSVGGTPDPIVVSLISWQPERIIFLASEQTASDVETKVLPLACESDVKVSAGSFDVLKVTDAQDLKLCIETWRPLSEEVTKWINRGNDFAVVVDFTGGTKCMTAGLALLAHRWQCKFSYVGGSERTKDGVGIVLSGREQIRHALNPWNALGRTTAEDALLLFNRSFFAAAVSHLDDAVRKITEDSAKRELATLKVLAEAYAAWDRFDHKTAVTQLKIVRKNKNDLLALLGHSSKQSLTEHVDRNLEMLCDLIDDTTKRDRMVVDLLANAKRRADEGRHDDAVARIYRAVEALAQNRLSAGHQIESDRVPVARLEGELQRKSALARDDGTVALGLQDCYALLHQLEDDLGKRFVELGWGDPQRSPLMARNQSILAHGFEPVMLKVFQKLFEGALQLAGLKYEDLPQFPLLT